MMSLPLAFMVLMISFPFSSTSIHAQPILTLRFSAVRSPMSKECLFLMYCIIASFILSPACLIDVLQTMPPSAIMATSVVPPPMSAIRHPVVPSTSIPAPIAAAIGSSRIKTSLAPSCLTTSLTARFSTSVTPLGTPTTTLKFLIFLALKAVSRKFLSISAVLSKSEITPS